MQLQKSNSLMVELNDLIKIHDNALEPEICDYLISLFEQFSDKHERIENDSKPNFTQFNFTENRNLLTETNEIHNLIIKKVFEYRDLYYEFIDKRVFPEEHAFEQFRIKRYNPGGDDWFDTHVDVTNHESSRRFLSFMWYLNDVETGGNTIFDGMMIKPKRGTLVIFPPLWMYPHRGEPPLSGPKYIMSAYLHYK